MKNFLFLFISFYLTSIPLWAEEGISVKAEVDKAFATIGDEINFRVTVTHHPDISILEFDAESALSDFEIKKTTPFSTQEGKSIREGKNYVITTYLLGDYVIRPMTVQYRTQSGEIKQLQTNNLYIAMESVDKNKSDDSDIKGVKGIRKIKNRTIQLTLLFILLSGALAGGIWYYLKRRKESAFAEKEKLLSPHEEAYLALNQLKNSDLIRKGLVKHYFFQISEILRRYLERRFHIPALESTTYELMNELKAKLDSEDQKLIGQLLDFCDLVKFAKYIPPALEIIGQTNQAQLIVDKTKEEIVESAATENPEHT